MSPRVLYSLRDRDETRSWVDISRMRRALNLNHFVDILDLHGHDFQMLRDDQRDTFIEAGTYSLRLQRLGIEFRRQVAGAFARAVGFENVTCISKKDDVETRAAATKQAMTSNRSMILGGVLADPRLRVFSGVPIILRGDLASDVLGEQVDAVHGYVLVSAKRRGIACTGRFLKQGCLRSLQSETIIWRDLAETLSGIEVSAIYVVGLSPRRAVPIAQGSIATDGCAYDKRAWRVGRVPDENRSAASRARDALRWTLDVCDESITWIEDAISESGCQREQAILVLVKGTTDGRLRPNMKSSHMHDWPWAKAKREIAEHARELTLLSHISKASVDDAMYRGIPNDYSHPDTTAEALGITSGHVQNMFTKCKESYTGPLVTPNFLKSNRANWRQLVTYDPRTANKFALSDAVIPNAEQRTFFVDFELAPPEQLYAVPRATTDDEGEEPGVLSDSNFDAHPSDSIRSETGPFSFIFMIGCGQIVEGEWEHNVFVADSLSQSGESGAVQRWLNHMAERSPPDLGDRFVYVWGPEKQYFREALKRMTEADKDAVKHIKNFHTVDMVEVVRRSELSIHGCFGFSVKKVARSLHRLGMLPALGERSSSDAVQDGADAMALALDAVEASHRNDPTSCALNSNMKLISSYNEADCRDIAQIVSYLKKNH